MSRCDRPFCGCEECTPRQFSETIELECKRCKTRYNITNSYKRIAKIDEDNWKIEPLYDTEKNIYISCECGEKIHCIDPYDKTIGYDSCTKINRCFFCKGYHDGGECDTITIFKCLFRFIDCVISVSNKDALSTVKYHRGINRTLGSELKHKLRSLICWNNYTLKPLLKLDLLEVMCSDESIASVESVIKIERIKNNVERIKNNDMKVFSQAIACGLKNKSIEY